MNLCVSIYQKGNLDHFDALYAVINALNILEAFDHKITAEELLDFIIRNLAEDNKLSTLFKDRHNNEILEFVMFYSLLFLRGKFTFDFYRFNHRSDKNLNKLLEHIKKHLSLGSKILLAKVYIRNTISYALIVPTSTQQILFYDCLSGECEPLDNINFGEQNISNQTFFKQIYSFDYGSEKIWTEEEKVKHLAQIYPKENKITNTTLQKLLNLDNKITKNFITYEKVKQSNDSYLPFHQFVLKGKINKIKEYLKVGYDINTKDIWGRNAIFYAIFNPDIKVLKFLVDNGADVNFKDTKFSNTSILHLAASEGYMDKTAYLLKEQHLNINEMNSRGKTPLSHSMIFENVEIAEYLIENGATYHHNIVNIDKLIIYLIERLKAKRESLKENNVVSLDTLNYIKKVTKFLKDAH